MLANHFKKPPVAVPKMRIAGVNSGSYFSFTRPDTSSFSIAVVLGSGSGFASGRFNAGKDIPADR